MIVGTAGHVDHGKTALVRALTGVDTDRLEAEKARGISIELGYAYVPAGPDRGDVPDQVLGFVDVPGHERFVHTMVAGATGIDFVLLVVAADDGVMPQTREHLAILELLDLRRGAVAVTKVDRAAPGRVAEVRAQVRSLLAATALADAPMFECDNTRAGDAGTAALLEHLRAHAGIAPGRARDALFRLPVDRVFALPGHGTTVTGPVHAGRARAGSQVVVTPDARLVRIRSIHAQGRPATQAEAGQRCALALAGIDTDAVARGDWIADARAFVPGRYVDVRLRLFASSPPLRNAMALHVHWGTTRRIAHVVVLDDGDAQRGSLVQLVFADPVCVATGDRFIVRDPGAGGTVGGGIVLDPEAPQRRRRAPSRLAWLAALERLLDGAGLESLLQHAPFGVPMATLVRRCQLADDQVVLPAGVLRIEGNEGGHVILAAHWATLQQQVVDAMGDWHRRQPDAPGIDAGRLRSGAFTGVPQVAWQALLQSLLGQGRVRRHGAWWMLPEHDRQLSQRDRDALLPLLPLLFEGRYDPPWVRTLATQLGIGEDVVRGVLRRAAARGAVYQVVPDLFYHPRRVDELARIVAGIACEHGSVDAARFRDALGLGRKRSIQILEFFDRVGYTRRVGDAHRPRGTLCWVPDAPREAG